MKRRNANAVRKRCLVEDNKKEEQKAKEDEEGKEWDVNENKLS